MISIKKLKYRNYEIFLINKFELKPYMIEKYQDMNIVKVDNQANKNAKSKNSITESTKGEYLIFLDNVEIISENWVEKILGYFQRENVGIVSCKVLFLNNKVYHNGIALKEDFNIEYINKGLDINDSGYMKRNLITQNFTLSTDIVILRKNDFISVDKFDENIINNLYANIDLCLRIRKLNKLIVVDSTILGYHYKDKEKESGKKYIKNDLEYIKNKYKENKIQEKYINKNLKLKKGIIRINEKSIRNESRRR